MEEVVKYKLYFNGDVKDLTRRGYTKYANDGYPRYAKGDVWIDGDDGYVSLMSLNGHSGALLAYLIDRDFVWQRDSRLGLLANDIMVDIWTGDVLTVDYDHELAVLSARDEATMVEMMKKYDHDRFIRIPRSLNESLVAELYEMYNAGEFTLTAYDQSADLNNENLDIPRKYELYYTGTNERLESLGYTLYGTYGATFVRDNVSISDDDGYMTLFDMGNYSGALLAYLIDRNFEWQTNGEYGRVSQNVMMDRVTGDVVDRFEGYDTDRYIVIPYAFSESFIHEVLDLYETGELELTELV